MAAEALAQGHRLTAGEAYARASLFLHFAQFMAFEDPVAKDAAAARKVALFHLAAPLLDPPAEPVEVAFENGTIRGWLRLPPGSGPHSLALIVPGSDSTKEEFPAFERHFLTRGIATLSFDGPGQGEGRSFGHLRPDFGPVVAAMVQAVAERADLSDRRVLVGMAFGGFLALRAASGVAGLAGVCSINGFHDLGAFWDALPQVYRDNMRHTLGAEDTEGRARRFTLAGEPPPETPALILHGGRDRIFPPDEAERSAGHMRDATLHIFPDGNHVCNNIPWLYRPLVADWCADRCGLNSRQEGGGSRKYPPLSGR
jgi:dipeptidyl aminopeptidase/acylaminoacyl peptidase